MKRFDLFKSASNVLVSTEHIYILVEDRAIVEFAKKNIFHCEKFENRKEQSHIAQFIFYEKNSKRIITRSHYTRSFSHYDQSH